MKDNHVKIAPEQRFVQSYPCPVCGGYDAEPRGQGKRCFGFLSNDGNWAHCTREEYAGTLQRHPISETFTHKLTNDCYCGERHDPLPAAVPNGSTEKRRIVAVYDYRDTDQKLLYQVVRFVPKDFRQRRPDGRGGWIWDLNGTKRVPYRLPELSAADKQDTVYLPEGEKDVERLRALGRVSTTNAGGADKWQDDFSEYLRDRNVVILPHNDEAGQRHAKRV